MNKSLCYLFKKPRKFYYYLGFFMGLIDGEIVLENRNFTKLNQSRIFVNTEKIVKRVLTPKSLSVCYVTLYSS